METVDYTDFTHIDTPPADRLKYDVGDIYMNVAVHTTCGWVIRSKNRHHMATCKCGKLSIDGGSWYIKLVGDIDNAVCHTVYYKEKHKDED